MSSSGDKSEMRRSERPPSFARAAMLLFAAAAALPLSLGPFFIDGGARLAVWTLPLVFATFAGLRELNGWRRAGASG
jgi:hypothetical protein